MKNYTLIALLLLVGMSLNAQRYELNAWLGMSSYQGDINKNQFILANEMDFSFGVGGKYNLNQSIGVSVNYSKGRIAGTDQNFDDRQFWPTNVSFTSDYHDLLFNVEWNILKPKRLELFDKQGEPYYPEDESDETPVFDMNGNQVKYQDGYFISNDSENTYIYNKAGEYTVFDQDGRIIETHYPKHFTPYLFTGIGVSYFDANPEGLPADAPELLDGAYSDIHFSVPVGMGFRYDFSKKFAVAMDGTFKYGFSDHLDGVSESRNPEKNDWVVTGGVKFIYKIGSKKDFGF